MIRRYHLLVCGFVAVVSVAQLVLADDVPPKPVDGTIAWIYDYTEGKRIARDTGKPMFVVFRCER